MARGRRVMVAGAFCAVVAGCAVTRDYRPEMVDAPPRWSIPDGGGEPRVTAQTPWWTSFGDPVLDSLVDRALRANLDFRLAQARVREARARVGTAAGSALPSVTAKGSAVRERESRNAPNAVLVRPDGTVEPPGTENLFQAGFDASWELDVFGGARRFREAAQADHASALYDRGGVALTLIAEVSRSYFELRGVQRQSRLARESLALMKDNLHLARVRLAAGMATETDVAGAETELAREEAQLPSLESAEKKGAHRLELLLGLAPGALAGELQPGQPVSVAAPRPAVGVPLEVLRRRPDVAGAQRRVAAASARVGVAAAELYPRFFLLGSVGLASEAAGDFFNPGSALWSLGPSISWPIFQRGKVAATMEVRDAQLQQALIEYRRAILNALEDVENALAGYRGEVARRESLLRGVASRQRGVAAARERNLSGLSDFRGVIDGERNLLQAQSELAQSETALLVDLVALYKALGGGWDVPSGEGE